jgi:tetratricopeptide (TPR) repeat protein
MVIVVIHISNPIAVTPALLGMAQWNIKVKLVELDRGDMKVKNRWDKGETITVQIEAHGTVDMLKQRVALIVAAHPKWQTLKVGDNELADPAAKLDSLGDVGVCDNCVIDLYAIAPKEKQEDLGELSDDPEAIAEEDEAAPGLPEGDAISKELTEDEEDKQNSLKGAAAEMLEDGDKAGALAKLTEAVMVGNPNAMLLARRGELLLKMKRPRAAVLDASAALDKNPDSAKAYKIRGKAQRLLGKYAEAVDDFAQCQKIDYDDSIVDMHNYCTKRKMWHMKMNARKEREEAAAAAEAAKS